MKYLSIFSQTSKSEITPSFKGLTTLILAGVLPSIRFASNPTATGLPSRISIATTEGSLSTIPCPRTYTKVFAVPRSMAISRPMDKGFLRVIRCDLESGSLLVRDTSQCSDEPTRGEGRRCPVLEPQSRLNRCRGQGFP